MAASLQYGPTRGYRPLRETTVEIMRSRHIVSEAEQVVVTTGSQQGLDLVARVLLDAGDVALMELPSYTGAITAFRNVGAEMVGVRQEADGIDLVDLDRKTLALRAAGRRVKLLYLVPNFQNPTGLLLGLAKRTQLLEWAERRDVLIIEDDPYRDLYFPDVTSEADTRPMAADDRHERVIYLSSFSKTLAPGFRVAWLSAPAALAGKLELAKQAEDLCTGAFDQRIVFESCRRGLLERHVPVLRAHYQHKRDTMVKALERHLAGQVTWTAPRGGFFLWVALTGRRGGPGCHAAGAAPRGDLRGRQRLLRRRQRCGVHAPVVFRAVAVPDRRRRVAAGRRDRRGRQRAGSRRATVISSPGSSHPGSSLRARSWVATGATPPASACHRGLWRS